MEVNKEKVLFFLQFFFDKGENFRYFDIKNAPHTGRPVVENVNKILEIIEVDRLVSSRSIAQGLKIDHETVDNARPYTPVVTRQNLWKLDWEVLMHPPYSTDLAPSDYHLFLTFQHLLVRRNWNEKNIVKIYY
ncbi:HTH_48 domain-containing protein [Trichonephila clavipes]|uniref:HTH_48 domain-containing protein n=1 Tax=Trichonephila clavipes TaxID=2585209 RepID=A0A8X6SS44_TRICX|nr:HTH_48 domain-containing protein [Trichonephila clavipes]